MSRLRPVRRVRITQSRQVMASAEMVGACLINGNHRGAAVLTFSWHARWYDIGDAARVIA